VVACLLALTAGSEPSASVAAASSVSVSGALEHSITSATEAGSARITVQFFSGSTTGSVVQDSSLNSGEQTVSIGKALASTVLVGGVAYISGNGKGMTSYFRLPSAVVPTLSGRWISVKPSNSVFQSVTANLALSSALADVTPSGALVPGKRLKVDGQWVKSISGAAPGGTGRMTLFVTADPRSLPVEAVESGGTGASARGEIVRFTRWGELLHIATPSRAVPISAIDAVSSASG